MNFLINTFNHHDDSQKTVVDVLTPIAGMLQALGHQCVWNNTGFVHGPDSMNILVEGFDEKTINHIAELHKQGARFIVLATEEPTPKGFNHGFDPLMVARQAMFPGIAPYIEGILHLVPGAHVTDWFGQFAPSAPAEIGYAPGLERFARGEPDHMFGFYGGGISKGSRRLKILQKLAKKTLHPNAVKVIALYSASVEERDIQMRRARVLLQIRLFEKMGLVSSSRCATAMLIGRPIIAEPHELSWPWSEVVHFSKTSDAFYGDAISALGIWRSLHETQFNKFKALFTPERCIGASLRQIGILPAQVSAAA